MSKYDEGPVLAMLQQAIELNNAGVDSALSGLGEDAVASFSKSLALLKRLMAEDDTDEPMLRSCDASTAAIHSSAVPTFSRKQLRGEDTAGFFLFNSLLRLAPKTSYKRQDNQVYVAVIILNLAVLYHQIAFQKAFPKDRVEALRRSAQFYGMVIKVLPTEDTIITHQPTNTLARLAALNNLAHMHTENGDYKASSDCFEVLAWHVRQSQATSISVHEADIFDGIMLNVLMANHQAVAAPAA